MSSVRSFFNFVFYCSVCSTVQLHICIVSTYLHIHCCIFILYVRTLYVLYSMCVYLCSSNVKTQNRLSVVIVSVIIRITLTFLFFVHRFRFGFENFQRNKLNRKIKLYFLNYSTHFPTSFAYFSKLLNCNNQIIST